MCSVHWDVPYSPGYLLLQFFNTLGHLVHQKYLELEVETPSFNNKSLEWVGEKC